MLALLAAGGLANHYLRDEQGERRAQPAPARPEKPTRPRAPKVVREVSYSATPDPDSAAVHAVGPTNPVAATNDDQPATEPPEERTEKERLEEEKRVLESTYAELEARFEAQELDRHWGSNTEAALTNAFEVSGAEGGGITVEQMECGSELCRTVLTQDPERDSQAFFMAFVLKKPPGLELHFKHEGGRTVIYSIRRDDALPIQE